MPVSIELEELPRLRRREDRRRPLGDDMLRPPHRRGGVHGEDLVDDEPVAEHTDRGQVLFHRGGRPRVGPDVGVRRPRPRVREIRPAKNSRNRATAAGPASTITCGRTISPAPPVAADGSAAAGTRASVVIPSPPLPRRLNDRRAPRTARNRFRAPAPASTAAPGRPPPRRTAPRSGRAPPKPPRAGSPAARSWSRPAP